MILLFEKPDDIHSVRIEKEENEKPHAYHLCVFKEFLGGFPACDHFIEEEQHMTTVESRNRKNIHEGESHGKECGDVPEGDPVLFLREDCADGTESSYTFSPLFSEYELH